MSYSNWINLGSFADGDMTITLSKGDILSNSITFLIVAYSSQWTEIDISFEYKLPNEDEWRKDALIDSTSSTYVLNNKLFGLAASKYGSSSVFRWNYESVAQYGEDIQARITVLPRVINYSGTNLFNIVSQTYENNKSDIEVSSPRKIINKNRDGQYLCIENNNVTAYSNIANVSSDFLIGNVSSAPFVSFIDPVYVAQKNDGRYLIVDYGFNGKIWDLSTAANYKSVSMYHPVFVDFSEENNTLLVCQENNKVSELVWDDSILTTNVLWQSNSSIINPVCATYGRKDNKNIVICDKGGSKVVIYNKDSEEYSEIDNYKIVSNSVVQETNLIHNPFRAYELEDGSIWICERDGEIVDFDLYESSSSSSSTSKDSHSSSSSSKSGTSSSSTLNEPTMYTVTVAIGSPPVGVLGTYGNTAGTCTGIGGPFKKYKKHGDNWYIIRPSSGTSSGRWDIYNSNSCVGPSNGFSRALGGAITGSYTGHGSYTGTTLTVS